MSQSPRLLETDFPLNPPAGSRHPPAMLPRSSSRDRNGASQNSLNRHSQRSSLAGGQLQHPPAYARSGSAHAPASDWSYEPQGAPAPAPPPQQTGRSGSLRRAYSDSSSCENGSPAPQAPLAGDEEAQLLYPQGRQPAAQVAPLSPPSRTSPQISQESNGTTSDYHSEQLLPAASAAAPAVKKPRKSVKKRQRKHDSDDGDMSGGARCCFGLFILLAQILLNGVMGLCLYWVIKFHSNKDGVPFSWKEDPNLEFNLHPVLMTAGFIYFMGQAMLMYRTCRCCRRIWNKLLHTIFHILAIPCVAIGFLAVLDSHNLRKDSQGNLAPIPNFYSLHSWMGLATMGLFCLQFVVGFFSFLLLLCCESATASFRASLVPIHSTFGITTFMLAIATACAGLTEKAFFSLSIAYSKWVPALTDRYFNWSTANAALTPPLGPAYQQRHLEESLVLNCLGAGLILLAIVIPLLVSYPKFRYRPQRVITVTHDRYG